ncbi:hypothetical protein DAETH_43240 (plasmid) [Deinococcus aetherius]|uniref:DUF1795 domain-containing protein n=1 Tax=Deinococcus aetherius TaxID=200252 RepID=A0ABN6RNE3_9DEIO|nr:hypothetical protein [Deinococcus aetherius]BDP44355.1 hypothetical protein DAETH_43240 [Deinococcus aetherius]
MTEDPDLPTPAARARVASLVLITALTAGPGAASVPPPSSVSPTLQAQVEAQPYRIGDWAGFRPLAVTSLDILMLGEAGEADTGDLDLARPLLTVAVSASPSPAVVAREAFARRALEFVPFVSGIVAQSAGTVRRGGAEWHETVGRARSPSDREVVVFQSIRFGAPGTPYLRVVGLAPLETRDDVLPRFRLLARSITPR